MGKKRIKQYRIKEPEKCLNCDKKDDCVFLEKLHQKPFDASGVILDCKSFYTVFCMLENQYRIPFGDAEKMKQYHKESDTGKRPFIIPALVTNGMLAVELALKALTLKETGTFDCIHRIDKLIIALPDVHRTELFEQIKRKAHQNEETLKVNLETISNYFEEWRYFFQAYIIEYSTFLTDFVHAVCDYAIEQVGTDATDD